MDNSRPRTDKATHQWLRMRRIIFIRKTRSLLQAGVTSLAKYRLEPRLDQVQSWMTAASTHIPGLLRSLLRFPLWEASNGFMSFFIGSL